MRGIGTWVVGLALTSAADAVSAQRVGGGWESAGTLLGERYDGAFGFALAAPGDLNGDGIPDLVVGAPGETLQQGEVVAISGASGSRLWRWGPGSNDGTGFALSRVGDLDGDGRPDLVVGSADAYVSEGFGISALLADGSQWWLVEQAGVGGTVEGVGDIDGDGIGDVAAGDGRSVWLFSGRDGTRLDQLRLPHWHHGGFGFALAALGDVDGDQVPDLAIGAPHSSHAAPRAGAVHVFSGARRSQIYWLGGARGSALGTRLARLDDLNGDGAAEFAASAPFANSGRGQVRVLDGRTGALVHAIDGASLRESIGHGLARISDTDQDGVSDLVVGIAVEGFDRSRLEIRSGASGSRLDSLEWISQGFGLHGIAEVGDVDTDGYPELAVGAPWSRGPVGAHGGAVTLLSFSPYLYASSSSLSVGSSRPVVARLRFPASEAGFRYAVLASSAGKGVTSAGGLAIPLAPSPLLDRMLQGWSPGFVRGAFGTLDANAEAAVRIDSAPILAAYVGRTITYAAMSYEPLSGTGRRSSIALDLRIVP